MGPGDPLFARGGEDDPPGSPEVIEKAAGEALLQVDHHGAVPGDPVQVGGEVVVVIPAGPHVQALVSPQHVRCVAVAVQVEAELRLGNGIVCLPGRGDPPAVQSRVEGAGPYFEKASPVVVGHNEDEVVVPRHGPDGPEAPLDVRPACRAVHRHGAFDLPLHVARRGAVGVEHENVGGGEAPAQKDVVHGEQVVPVADVVVLRPAPSGDENGELPSRNEVAGPVFLQSPEHFRFPRLHCRGGKNAGRDDPDVFRRGNLQHRRGILQGGCLSRPLQHARDGDPVAGLQPRRPGTRQRDEAARRELHIVVGPRDVVDDHGDGSAVVKTGQGDLLPDPGQDRKGHGNGLKSHPRAASGRNLRGAPGIRGREPQPQHAEQRSRGTVHLPDHLR